MRSTALALTLVLFFALPAGAQDLFITNARIVDPAARETVTGNLLIRDGVIVGRPATAPAGYVGQVVDVDGKWVIPGLADMHTHAYGNMAPDNQFDNPGTSVVVHRMLYAGVTAFLDLFGNEDNLVAIKQRQRDGDLGGAQLYASLSCLTATEGHCTEYGTWHGCG